MQEEHDAIIITLEKKLMRSGNIVYVNIGKNKTHRISRNNELIYPDLFTVADKGNTKYVKEIFEVETEGSVNEDSAKQWKNYSEGQAKFNLVVPRKFLEKAKELCAKYAVDVNEYWSF